MPRITVSISNDQDAWIAEKAEETGRSKADIVRRCINVVQSDAAETVNIGAHRIDVMQTDALVERIDELESRIEAIEQDGHSRPRPHASAERREADDVSDTDEKESLSAPTEPDLGDEVPDHVDADEARAAIHAARDYIADENGASMSEIVLNVMPEHPLGYDVEGDRERIQDSDRRNRSTWWRRVVKPGLESLDDVEKPVSGASEWNIIDAESYDSK